MGQRDIWMFIRLAREPLFVVSYASCNIIIQYTQTHKHITRNLVEYDELIALRFRAAIDFGRSMELLQVWHVKRVPGSPAIACFSECAPSRTAHGPAEPNRARDYTEGGGVQILPSIDPRPPFVRRFAFRHIYEHITMRNGD